MTSVSQGGVTIKSFGYDTAGRTTSVVTGAGTTTLSYDFEGRISGITYPNSSTNSFSYNGLDTRVSKTDSSGTTTYKRDGVGVTDPVINDGTANYTPAISERRSSTTKFVHSDQLGSMTRLTDPSQSTTDTRQYDAFGMTLGSTGSTLTPFAFAGLDGYQSESDCELMLVGHRYYDPSTGRFLTRDPVRDGRNWSVYCSNNPVTGLDPTGYGGGIGGGGRLTYIYALVNRNTLEIEKWGITYHPTSRYKVWWCDLNKVDLKVAAACPNRKDAREIERIMEEDSPGFRNRVPWAGKGKIWKDVTDWGLIIVTRDPMAAGEKFGEQITPWVEEAKAKRQASMEKWLNEDDCTF